MWELVYQLLEQELNNIISLTFTEVEGHCDTEGCNVSSANQSHVLCPFFNNIINNHDVVYSSDVSNHTKKVRSSTVKCVSSKNKGIIS